jgi:BirA family biotin operon repressor/biotin-[acetyl-CoA-carboxylase] ligase
LIGIGLNVTTRLEDAPPEVRRMAVTLAEICDGVEKIPLEEVLDAILVVLPEALEHLAGNDDRLSVHWSSLDTLRDQPVRVDVGPRVLTGVGRGIDAEGALLLATDEGPVRLFGGRVLRD